MAGNNNYKRAFTTEKSKPKSISRWIATNLLKIPASIFEATTNITISLTGLVKKAGTAFGADNRDPVAPDFDMQQIDNAYHADGYVREAVDKYIDLIMKPGYDIIGKNVKAVEYIKIRFAYMAECTGIPFDVLINEIATDMIKFHNVIIAKARTQDPATLPQGSKVTGLDGFDPIGGYFVQPITTIKVKRDKNGIVKQWSQEVDQQKAVKFKPQDIIHMYMKREPGTAFAYPRLLSVIDDVRALREIEERVLHMIFRNVHPLIHAKVGTKDLPGQAPEVDELRAEMDNMSVGGGVVTTERVTLDAISTKSTLDAEPYLLYFEKRVFTGLGVSSTMMGRGDTSNRSTSDNQKEEAVDKVKAVQRVLSIFITQNMISEILREGGFDPINKPEDQVSFVFKDPDFDSKVKAETHAVLLYTANAITENEMRVMLGRDPIPDGERSTLWFPQYGQKDVQGQASNTVQPANQSGKKTSPKKQTNILLSSYLEVLKGQILDIADSLYSNKHISNDAYVEGLMKECQTQIRYTEVLVSKVIANDYGVERYGLIKNNINQVFNDTYNSSVDIMTNFDTERIAKETISTVFDILTEELKYLFQKIREDTHIDTL